MKSKQNIILAYLIIPAIFACTNKNQFPDTITLPENKNVSSDKIGVIKSKYGTIKPVLENHYPENILYFPDDPYNSLELTLSLINNKIYLPYQNGLQEYDLNQGKLINSSCPSDRGGTIYDENTPYVPEPKICKYAYTNNISSKKGKDNNSYIFNDYLIGKYKNDDIVEIYNDYIPGVGYKNAPISHIAIDKNSNIYITYYRKNIIKKFNSDFKEEWTRSTDNTEGDDFSIPTHIETDNNGNIYFLDESDHKVKKMTEQGIVSTVIGGGNSLDASVKGTEYKIPDNYVALSIDNNDYLYLIEKTNNRIIKYDDKTTLVSIFAGGGTDYLYSENKPATIISLSSSLAMTFDSNNNAYILDSGNKLIRKLDGKTGLISNILGADPAHGDGNDVSKVFFKNIIGIYSKNNNLYVSESDRIRKIDIKGFTKTIAGNGKSPSVIPSSNPFVIDTGLPADKSTLYNPKILYIDKDENIYTSGAKITNDNMVKPLPSELNASESATEDSKGNLYFSADIIRKLDANNHIENFRGVYGSEAKGLSDLSRRSIVADSKDNIYAIAYGNSGPCIIRISPDETVRLIAGINGNTTNLTGSRISINPSKIIIDKNDNLYFINDNSMIMKIDNKWKMTTYLEDVNFKNISDITVDDNGYLYFSTSESKIYRIE